MGATLSNLMPSYGSWAGSSSTCNVMVTPIEDNNERPTRRRPGSCTLGNHNITSCSSPRRRASFAVMSRLLSCLVTEQILQSFYVPLAGSEVPDSITECSGFIIVKTASASQSDAGDAFSPDEVLVVVPLHHPPVLREEYKTKLGWKVGLVDPLDMLDTPLAVMYDQSSDSDLAYAETILSTLRPLFGSFPNQEVALRDIKDPIWLWRSFSKNYPISNELRQAIELELQSSFEWQERSYANPPICPTIKSPAIEWEQSLVAGHPTHPMHRARMFKSVSLDYDWYHPIIRFAKVKKADMEVLGDFDRITRRLVHRAFARTGHSLLRTDDDDDDYVYVPVHELQVSNVQAKFQNVELLSEEVTLNALAQSSIRTVEIPDFPGLALKLAVGVKISSALRTISHFTANFGPRFSRDIVPLLAVDPEILTVELETSAATYRTPNQDLAKHFTAVIREEYVPAEGETAIVVAALLESGHGGVGGGASAVEHVFDLKSEQEKQAFLERYIHIACRALIPALIKNGVAFEAHAQNVLARFDVTTKEFKGFVIRDLGGLRVHPSTLHASTGVDFQFLPGHVVATSTLEEIFPKFYHTFVHNHIQRFIRLLGMHYDGRGWQILRKEMEAVIPRDHPVWKEWMDPESKTVDSKCLMRMRMKDSYRDMVYSPYPNMIQYRPQSLLDVA